MSPGNASGAVTSPEELEERLAALPPVRAGYRRVFRGQSQDYGVLLPAAFRPKARSVDWDWYFYSVLLAHAFWPEDTDPDALSALMWAQATAQHYGPGTSFLDVTTSWAVASWFALHEAHAVRVMGALGPPGPVTPADMPAPREWIRYVPRVTGVLYVLDVLDGGVEPPWQDLHHGTLVDCQWAPRGFYTPRMRAQQACLVYADRRQESGDLRGFVVGEPLVLHSVVDRAPFHQLDGGVLFPTPAADSWYRKLLSIPLVPVTVDGQQKAALRPATSITIYEPPTTDEWGGLFPWFITLNDLPIGLDGVATPPLCDEEGPESPAATHIVLEQPLFATLPPVDHTFWVEGQLTANLPGSTSSICGAAEGETVTLTDVLVDLSPLERVDWDELGQGASAWVLRALRLTRVEDHYHMRIHYVNYALGKDKTIGICVIQHGDHLWGRVKPPRRLHESPLDVVGKALYVVLMVLHQLGEAGEAGLLPVCGNHRYYLLRFRREWTRAYGMTVWQVAGSV